jgi:hypothetical protein
MRCSLLVLSLGPERVEVGDRLALAVVEVEVVNLVFV